MFKGNELAVHCVVCKKTREELLEKSTKSHSIGGKNLVCEGCVSTAPKSIFDDYILDSKGMLVPHPNNPQVQKEKEPRFLGDIYSPRFIYNHLNRYVSGHDEVKRQLSVAMSNHIKRFDNPDLPKETILITGRTGMGKTLLIETMGALINCPFASVDASPLTGSGWVGDDVKSAIEALYYRSGKNVEATERGIILLDEFDKKCTNTNIKQANIDTSAVQQQLLRMIEGEKVTIGRDNAKVTIDTSNILFILSGSFEGQIGETRNTKKIGLTESNGESSLCPSDVYSDDWFLKLGMVRELLGRITTVVTLRELTVDEVIDAIFEREGSAFAKYASLCADYGFNLKISKEYSQILAKEVLEKPFGMRMAKRILADRVNPLLFDCSKFIGKTVTLYKDRIRVSKPREY